jgi:hypothetical protein
MGNKPVLTIVLILVIVVAGFFVVRNLTGKKAGAPSAAGPQDRDLICLACEKSFKATLKDEEWMPMQMQGKNASKKVKCTACGKDDGVAATKCGSCGELVPAVGMMGMMGPGGAKPPMCPKCKKPVMQAPQSAPSGAPAK